MAQGKLAGAYAGYGAATRKVDKTEKTWEGINQVIDIGIDAGTAYAIAKADKDTAWSEYESGYEDVTGESYDPEGRSFKDFWKGPEGEVTVGDSVYKREDVRSYGELKGSIKDEPLYQMPFGDSGKTLGEVTLERQKSGIEPRSLKGEQLELMKKGKAPGLYRETRDGGPPVSQDNSLDAILQRQSDSATPQDKKTSMIGYGGGGSGVDSSKKGTGNEFIDRKLGGYTEPAPASIYPESRFGEYRKRLHEYDFGKGNKKTAFETYNDQY